MIHDRKFAEKYATSNRDIILGYYRKIGISAVAAALEVISPKPEGAMPSRKDIPAILRDEMTV
jgi:hypothetical protein